MDINQIESLIFSEWEDFYIDYKKILIIIGKLNNYEKKEKKENNNIDINTFEEKLLENNEQNDEEKKRIDNNRLEMNNVFKKYIKQLNLEKDKISFFDNILQNKRHKKRFEEIIEQLKYIENNETIKIFKKQLLQSLKNLYREITNYEINYLDVNNSIMNDIIYPEETRFMDENPIINNEENFQILKKIKNDISLFFEKAKEYNIKFLCQINEQYKYYSEQEKEEEQNSDDENDNNNITNNNLPNPKRLQKAKFKLKLYKISFWVMIVLLFLCSFIYFFYLNIDIDEDPEFRSLIPMYRTYGIICLYLWFIGLNIKAWEDIRINYRALFSFQLSKNSIIDICTCASIFCSFLFLSFLIYFITRTPLGIRLGLNLYNIADILPAFIWLSLLLYFFCPFKILNYEGRNNIKKLFWECIASILIPIEFKHIWFMDQLTSLIGPMRDIEYTFCYYSYYENPFETRQLNCSNSRVVYLIIAIFPNLFRCLQVGRQIIDNQKVFPYIFNIGKYTFNIIVATFSFLSQFHIIFYYFWLANAFISGCYSSFWDLKMDWGYFESNSYNWPLRNKTKFKKKLLCILSIPVDIILRFLWMLSISPEIMSQYIKPEFLALVLYTLEMIRRAIWNFIRVEFEHYELEKMYQISFYEELPLIKLSNGKYMTNENKLLNILDVEKKDRMILELRELFNSLDKDKKKSDINKETSLNHLIENKKYEKNIKTLLDEYLTKYKYDSNQNSFN